MRIFVEPVSAKGKREDWLVVSHEKGEGGKQDIKLSLSRGRGPVVKSKFEFLSGKFGKIKAGKPPVLQPGAEFSARLYISVVVQVESGMIAKLTKQASEVVASEVEVAFKVLLVGSDLEIENVKLAWDSRQVNPTLPKKEVEEVFRLMTSAKLPESLLSGADEQALLLLELFRGSRISV